MIDNGHLRTQLTTSQKAGGVQKIAKKGRSAGENGVTVTTCNRRRKPQAKISQPQKTTAIRTRP
jgi:hypothetical protein